MQQGCEYYSYHTQHHHTWSVPPEKLTESSVESLSGFHTKSKCSHSSLEILLQWALNYRLRPISTTSPSDCGGCGFDLFNKTALSARRSRNRPFQSSSSFAWAVTRQVGDKQGPQTKSLIKTWSFSKWNSPYRGWVLIKSALKVSRIVLGWVESNTSQRRVGVRSLRHVTGKLPLLKSQAGLSFRHWVRAWATATPGPQEGLLANTLVH